MLEELGRNLAPTPWSRRWCSAPARSLLGGSEAQQRRDLPAIVARRAHRSRSRTRRARATRRTRRDRAPSGRRAASARGEKIFVLDGHVADAFVVVARTSATRRSRGLTLFLVAAPRAGRRRSSAAHGRQPQRRARSPRRRRRAATTHVARRGRATAPTLLERVLDRAAVGARRRDARRPDGGVRARRSRT